MGPSGRTLGHWCACKRIIRTGSLLFLSLCISVTMKKTASSMAPTIMCCLATGPKVTEPSHHGLKPPTVDQSRPFGRFTSGIFNSNRKLTNILTKCGFSGQGRGRAWPKHRIGDMDLSESFAGQDNTHVLMTKGGQQMVFFKMGLELDIGNSICQEKRKSAG